MQGNQLKENESQITRDNVTAFMEGKFSFSPEKLLNKSFLIFPKLMKKE